MEAHHKVRLEDGGAPYAQSNLECLCRSCHVEHHRDDRSTPGRAEWRALVAEIAKT